MLNNSGNANEEHEELLAEMELIERLPTQERLKQAKRRRALQLKKWADYERECQLLEQPSNPFRLQLQQTHTPKQHFQNGQLTMYSSSQSASSSSGHHYRKNVTNKPSSKNAARSIRFQDHILLLDAIMRKDFDEIQRLLESGVSPNSANEDGLTAIHQCCIDDSDDLLRLLIRYGADVNVCDNDLWTPLHAAATCANLEICKILIENNADLLAVNTDGNMPYDICDDEVCLEFIESEMARRGVTQQTIDMKRSETEMRMLDDLKQMVFLTTTTTHNSLNTPPTSLSLNSNSFLSTTGATTTTTTPNIAAGDRRVLDLNAKDHRGATLAHIACANGYTSVLEFLFSDCYLAAETGLPIIPPTTMVRDNDGWTPLHVATFWGHQRAIEILLEQGADVNAKTNNNETALELCDDQEVREFIIQKSKEIESKQQQAAAAAAARAALQVKLHLINSHNNGSGSRNNSSMEQFSSLHHVPSAGFSNGSISNLNSASVTAVNNSSISNINCSSRSLKRTSTGVSRSSSVRRSSFRDKEKAARKLDTSFKEALYASQLNVHKESASPEPVDPAPTPRGQIARIYSNGSILVDSAPSNLNTVASTTTTTTAPAPAPAAMTASTLSTNPTNTTSTSSNMSSYASSNSLPRVASASSLIQQQQQHHNHNHKHAPSANTTAQTPPNQNQNQTTMTIISQLALGHTDDVIYKFKSNKVVGGKASHRDDEFGDLDSDAQPNRLSKCYNFLRLLTCFKCF